MFFKNNKLLVLLLLLIIILIIITVNISQLPLKETSTSEAVISPFFLANKSSIFINPNTPLTLTLIFVDSKDGSIIENSINSYSALKLGSLTEIEINNQQVIKGSEYQDIALYSLAFEIQFSKTGIYSFDELFLSEPDSEELAFDIGEYVFEVVDIDPYKETFDIDSHSALHPTLDKYAMSISNPHKTDIIINHIDVGTYKELVEDIVIFQNNNDPISLLETNFTLKPDNQANIEIIFAPAIKLCLYSFNPKIEYINQGEKHEKMSIVSVFGGDFKKEDMNLLQKKALLHKY